MPEPDSQEKYWGGRAVSNRHLREGFPAHYQAYATPAGGLTLTTHAHRSLQKDRQLAGSNGTRGPGSFTSERLMKLKDYAMVVNEQSTSGMTSSFGSRIFGEECLDGTEREAGSVRKPASPYQEVRMHYLIAR